MNEGFTVPSIPGSKVGPTDVVRHGSRLGLWTETKDGRVFLEVTPYFTVRKDLYLCGHCNRWISLWPSKGIFRFHKGPGWRACKGSRERPEDTYKTKPPK